MKGEDPMEGRISKSQSPPRCAEMPRNMEAGAVSARPQIGYVVIAHCVANYIYCYYCE